MKTTLAVVMVLVLAAAGFGQVPVLDYMEVMASGGYDDVQEVLGTQDGGSVVLNHNYWDGQHDIQLIKYDHLGFYQWHANHSFAQFDLGLALSENGNGDIIMVGGTRAAEVDPWSPLMAWYSGVDGSFMQGGINTYVAADLLTDVVKHNDGDFFVCGTIPGVGMTSDAYVARLHANGMVIEEGIYDHAGYDDRFEALRLRANESVVLSGTVYDNATDHNMITAAWDVSGFLFTTTHGTGLARGTAVDFLPDGTIFFGGEDASGGNNEDFYIVKTDSVGTLLDSYIYGDAEANFLHDMIWWGDTIVLAGIMAAPDTYRGLIGMDFDGNVVWHVSWSSVRSATSLFVLSNDQLLWGGDYEDFDDLDNPLLACVSRTGGQPDATLTVWPDMDPPTVPAQGGTLGYWAELVNNVQPTVQDVRIVVTHLDIGWSHVVRQYNDVNLPMGTRSHHFLLEVPGGAPMGTYELSVQIGNNPNNPLLSDSFTFVKEQLVAGGGTASLGEWRVTGGFDEEDEKMNLPTALTMQRAYPNPFNPTTTVAVSLPQASELTVTVSNLLGRQVAVLEKGRLSAGEHSFVLDGHTLASGTYLVSARTPGSAPLLQRVTLVK